jgi:hypothetical protein
VRWWLRIGIGVMLLGVLLWVVAPAAALAPMPTITDWRPGGTSPRPPITDPPPGPPPPPETALAPPVSVVWPGVPAVLLPDVTLARLVPELPTGPVPPLGSPPG